MVGIENLSRIGDKNFWISFGFFNMDPEEENYAEAAEMAVISDNVI